MMELTEIISTLQKAQESVDTLAKWKTFLFSETNLCLTCMNDPLEKNNYAVWEHSFKECLGILYALDIGQEWKESSEVYKQWEDSKASKR